MVAHSSNALSIHTPSADAVRRQVEASLEQRYPCALTVRPRPRQPMLLSGIAAIDGITGNTAGMTGSAHASGEAALRGIPRGALTEICGGVSSGRTSLLYALLARAAAEQQTCALIDAGDSFDPASAAEAGLDLRRLLWVRCTAHTAQSPAARARRASQQPGSPRTGTAQTNSAQTRSAPFRTQPPPMTRIEQALKATDLVLQAGGFGLVAIDFGDIAPEYARRVPLTSWFRFRRAVENVSTALVVLEQTPHARTCASLVVELEPAPAQWSHATTQSVTAHSATVQSVTAEADRPISILLQPAHARLLRGFETEVHVTRNDARNGHREVHHREVHHRDVHHGNNHHSNDRQCDPIGDRSTSPPSRFPPRSIAGPAETASGLRVLTSTIVTSTAVTSPARTAGSRSRAATFRTVTNVVSSV